MCKLLSDSYPEAIRDFNEAISLKSDYALAYHDRATAKRYIGDYQGALYDYRMATNYQYDFIGLLITVEPYIIFWETRKRL